MAVPHDENQVPLVTVAASGYVATGNNATNTTAGTDYPFTWTKPVNHIMICNKTGANVYYELDAPASLGSPAIGTTYGATVFLDVQTTTLHLYTAAQQNVNGTADGGVVVRAWV